MTQPISQNLNKSLREGTQHQLNRFNIPSDLDTVQYRVIKLLEQFEETRNSDKLLLLRYYKYFEGVDTKLDMVDTPPETITRARRKIQTLNSELAASEDIKDARFYKQQEYKDYFKDDLKIHF